jgi:class 3 adenylate cyclase
MAVAGLPEPRADHAYRIVDLALAMQTCTIDSGLFPDMSIRIGVHSGPVAGGVIGTHKFSYDVWGNTVNVASRLEKAGLPGRIQVSEATKTLTEDEFTYEPRGDMDLRGVGPMSTYFVVRPKSSAPASTGDTAVAGHSVAPE